MAPVGWVLLACGPEPATRTVTTAAPPPPPREIRIIPSRAALALDQTFVLQATVSREGQPVPVWVSNCETGRLALAVDPLGTSATITAERAGTCFVWATVDGNNASSWIRISPLPMGDGCLTNSECAAEAPACQVSDEHCGKTCTRACDADADCPAPFKCAVGRHVCRAINNPDDVCA